MFGQLMLISGHAPTSLNSQPPFTAKHNEQCRINSGEIVVVVSNKPVESEFLVIVVNRCRLGPSRTLDQHMIKGN